MYSGCNQFSLSYGSCVDYQNWLHLEYILLFNNNNNYKYIIDNNDIIFHITKKKHNKNLWIFIKKFTA